MIRFRSESFDRMINKTWQQALAPSGQIVGKRQAIMSFVFAAPIKFLL